MSDLANTQALAWDARPLAELFRINRDQVVPMAMPKSEFVHYSIPAWDASGGPAIELGFQIESNKTSVSIPSVLASKLNPRKPRVVAVRTPTERTCCSTEFICYQPKRPFEDLNFWASYFASNDFSGRLARIAVGSTNSHTRAAPRETLKWLVPEVPAAEQGKISEVLGILDTAIHETEAIIAKLKAVKQGLLHDLLTRGIDARGELRPPQAEAPHLYKPSPLGWIPKEWSVKELAELLAPVDPAMRSGPFGSALLKQELVEVGHPLLGIDNVHTERFVSDYARFVTPKKFAQLARYAVRPADLMITIMGTVGRCCLVPDTVGQALSSKHTWTITLDQDAYSPYLAMLQVNYSPWVLAHFARDQQGGTMAAIRSETLRSTLLPSPPREEQRLLEDRLREITKRIDLEADAFAKMQTEKSGLMDDLLTGRVRVTPLLDAAAP